MPRPLVVGTIAVAVIAVVVSLVAGGVSAVRAGTESSALLESARVHANSAEASFTALPAFDLSGASPASAKQAADQYAAKLGALRATVEADQLRLRFDRDRLAAQANGALELPFRGFLGHERQRAESMLAALEAEDAEVQILQGQMLTFSALFDAAGDLVSVDDRLGQQDVQGALALVSGLDAKLQTAARLAGGPNTPPQIQELVAQLRSFSADLDAYLQAGLRQDRTAVAALQPKLDADSAGLQTFDQRGFDAYERALVQPYQDRFDAAIRAAGFLPVH